MDMKMLPLSVTSIERNWFNVDLTSLSYPHVPIQPSSNWQWIFEMEITHIPIRVILDTLALMLLLWLRSMKRIQLMTSCSIGLWQKYIFLWVVKIGEWIVIG